MHWMCWHLMGGHGYFACLRVLYFGMMFALYWMWCISYMLNDSMWGHNETVDDI